MEECWENWHLHMEMNHDDDDFLDQCHTYDEDFLREILLQQPAFTSDSKTDHSSHNNSTAATATATDGGVIVPSEEMAHMVKNKSSNSIVSQQHGGSKRPLNTSRTCILSFDDSTMKPITPETPNNYDQLLGNVGTLSSNPTLPSNTRSLGSRDPEPRPRVNYKEGGGKKARNSSQTMDHIMAERKRRQELTERFIALSATIPGLHKTDKASILRAAIDYVKQLQEKVQELEKEDKNSGTKSVILIKRSDLCANEDSNSSETSSEDCCTLPEIEARVLGNEILIEIHCEKEIGIDLKILDQLENLQLYVTGSSVLPFGNSTLGITIIAQMGNTYKITVNDLVKNLRQVLLNSHTACHSDPY